MLTSVSFGQTYSSIVSDSTILNFMNWEIKNGKKYSERNKLRMKRKISSETLKFENINFYLPDTIHLGDWEYREFIFNRFNKIDSLFTKTEIESIFLQYKAIKDTVWSHKITGANIGLRKFSLNEYFYSVPIFTNDNKYVLIKKLFYCGNECAYGGIYLYKRIADDQWELVKVLNGWMS